MIMILISNLKLSHVHSQEKVSYHLPYLPYKGAIFSYALRIECIWLEWQLFQVLLLNSCIFM